MDKDYFEENKRQYAMSFNRGSVMNTSRDLLINQSQNFKLSLRKNRLNNFITAKRMMNQARQNRKLEITLDAINLSNIDTHPTFSTMDELYQFIKRNLNSKNKEEIKFGIYLLKHYINSNIEQSSSELDEFNTNLISDLFDVFDIFIEKDLLITYELLNIMINLTYLERKSKISKMCITPMSYRLWERICRTENADLISNLVWLFGNMACSNKDIGYNILLSNTFDKFILPFFEEEKYKVFNAEEKMSIIETGSAFLSKLIFTEDEKSHQKIFELNRRIFLLLLQYYNKYGNEIIITATVKAFSMIETSIELYIDLVKHSDLIPYIIRIKNPSFCLQTSTIRLIGNISAQTEMSDKKGWPPGIEMYILLYLTDALESFESEIRKETLWCLSNFASESPELTHAIITNQKSINQIIKILREDRDIGVINEGVFLLGNLLNSSRINDFDILMGYRILPLLLESVVKFDKYDTILEVLFQSIGICLKNGELRRTNPMEDNLVLKAFIELGGKDLLEKYQNTQRERLYSLIQEIMLEFFTVREVDI